MTVETPADRLRGELLGVAAELAGARPPVLVREWADTLELHGAPVGHRYFALVAVERGPGASEFDRLVAAFTARGWSAHRWNGPSEGVGRATAKRDGWEVTAHQGRGLGVITLSGRTPAVFLPGHRGLRQPVHTLSTGAGLLCEDCHGWGVCLNCEGTGRSRPPAPGRTRGRVSHGRCGCWAGQAGPGRCADCAGQGRITSATLSWQRSGHHAPGPTAAPPPAADALTALLETARRPCACGSLACHWQLARNRTELRISGPCQSCARPRSYSFALPPACC